MTKDTKNKLPYYSLYTQDFASGTAYMSDEEVGCYIRILNLQWDKGPIPVDRFELYFRRKWEDVSPYVREKFEVGNGVIWNERLLNEYEKASQKYSRHLAKSLKGVIARKEKLKDQLQQETVQSKVNNLNDTKKNTPRPVVEPVVRPVVDRRAFDSDSDYKEEESIRKEGLEGRKKREEEIEEVFDFLNSQLLSNNIKQRKLKLQTSRRKLILSRLKEGYSVEEIKTTIQYKINEWKGGEMEKYLRPETLFQKIKFLNYFEQSENGTKTQPAKKQPRGNENFAKRDFGTARGFEYYKDKI